MTTSGTVGATNVDIATIIEHACRRTGKLASSLTSEQLLAARENLFFILSDLVNRGISLWLIQKQVLTITYGTPTIPLSTGTVDVLKATYRTQSIQSTGSAISGGTYQGWDSGAGNTFTPISVQVTFNAGTNNLVVESSPDGSTWTTLQTIPAFTTTAGQQLWLDLTTFTTNRAFRIRETVLGSTYATATSWAYNPQEILMAKLTRDQYWLMPNKSFLGRPLQYWYDKQVAPQISCWPAPNDTTAAIVVYYTSYVQDPGAFTNNLQIPIRWYNGIVWLLAGYLANELPGVDQGRMMLCLKMADIALNAAEMGENDGAPLQFDPGILPYTR